MLLVFFGEDGQKNWCFEKLYLKKTTEFTDLYKKKNYAYVKTNKNSWEILEKSYFIHQVWYYNCNQY